MYKNMATWIVSHLGISYGWAMIILVILTILLSPLLFLLLGLAVLLDKDNGFGNGKDMFWNDNKNSKRH